MTGAIAAGLCSVTFRGLDVASVVAVASAAGLTHLEWGGDVHVPPGDTDAARATAQATADAGLVVASYGSYLHAGRLQEGAQAVETVLDTAVVLGAPNVRVWASGERAAEELASVCAAAADRDLAISVEYHPGTATETARDTLELLDAVGAANLWTYWQPDPALDVQSQLRDLGAVVGHLSHLHVFSWRSDRSRLPLEEGAALWEPAVIKAAIAPPPPGEKRVAFLEFVREDSPAHLSADAAVLRRWLADAS